MICPTLAGPRWLTVFFGTCRENSWLLILQHRGVYTTVLLSTMRIILFLDTLIYRLSLKEKVIMSLMENSEWSGLQQALFLLCWDQKLSATKSHKLPNAPWNDNGKRIFSRWCTSLSSEKAYFVLCNGETNPNKQMQMHNDLTDGHNPW